MISSVPFLYIAPLYTTFRGDTIYRIPVLLTGVTVRVGGKHRRDEGESEVAHRHAGCSHVVDGPPIAHTRDALVPVWSVVPLVGHFDAHSGSLPREVVRVRGRARPRVRLILTLTLRFNLPCEVGDAA